MRCRSKLPPRRSRHDDQYGQRPKHPDRADIVQPLPDIHSTNIQHDNRRQPERRECHVVQRTRAQAGPMRPKPHRHRRRSEIQHPGKERQIAHPVHPRRDKSGKITECGSRPYIQTAFFGMPRRQLHHTRRQRNKEARQRCNPDNEDARARRRCRRCPAHIQRHHHIEQRQIAKANPSFQCWSGDHVRRSIPEPLTLDKFNS
jgi:hypothetical protein